MANIAAEAGFRLPDRREYAPQFFVNHDDAIKLVDGKVVQGQAGAPVDEPIVNFWGPAGIGKTWLLKHMREKYTYPRQSTPAWQIPTCALLCDFGADRAPTPDSVTQCLAAELLSQAGPTLSTAECATLRWVAQAPNAGAFVTVLLDTVSPSRQRLCPLILLDHCDTVGQDTWQQIEFDVIEPLVASDRVLFLTASRRPLTLYNWKRFEVRRRATSWQRTCLAPFKDEDIEREVGLLEIDLDALHLPLKSLYPYTAGSPYVAQAMFELLVPPAEARRLPQQGEMTTVLEVVKAAEREMWKGVPGRLFAVLDAIAPLRFFTREMVQDMLARMNTTLSRPPLLACNRLCQDLEQDTELVAWDTERSAYVMNAVLRRLIDAHRLLETPDLYEERHEWALDWYRNQGQIYVAAKDVLEIWFHLVKRNIRHNDPTGLMVKIRATWQEFEPRLTLEAKHAVHQLLVDDTELCSLLPQAVLDEIGTLRPSLIGLGGQRHDDPIK